MNEIEITVKANFSTKINLAKTLRRICVAGMLIGALLSQVDVAHFKTAQHSVNIAQPFKSLAN